MRLIVRLSAAFTMLASVIVSSNEAYASRLGCSISQITDAPVVPNAISVDMILPYGYLCHLIEARGKEVSAQRAAYTSSSNVYGPLVSNICNWRIDFVYYGTDGNEYLRDKGETANGCKKGASRIVEKSKTLPQYGSACSELYVDGKVRLIQCHSMTE